MAKGGTSKRQRKKRQNLNKSGGYHWHKRLALKEWKQATWVKTKAIWLT